MTKLSRSVATQAALYAQVDWALRELSTSTVLAANAIAQKVGLGPNDLKCAELLVRHGPLTAGQLAEATGLTTGAITGIVDRLEKAGWARRTADPHDRRKVIIQPGPQDTQALAGLYEGHMQALEKLLGGYSDAQLKLILQFVRGLTALNNAQAGKGPSEEQPVFLPENQANG
jgi:DNA-binding MarR family transcriptional regulator